MQTKHKSPLLAAMFLALLWGLSGCQKGQMSKESVSRIPAKQQAENVYLVETTDLQVTPKISPIVSSLLLTEEALYFRTWENNIYREDLQKSVAPIPRRLDISFVEGESLKTFLIDEQKKVVCIVQDAGGEYAIKCFSQEGELLSELPLKGIEGMQGQFTVNKAVVDNAGNFYMQTDTTIWLFRADGQYVGEVEIPAEYILDIGISKEGRVFVTYYANMIEVILSEVSFDNCRLEGNAVIPGNGRLFQGRTQGLLLFDSAYLYEYNPDTGKYTVPMDWVEHYVNTGTIQGLVKKADGSIYAVTWNCGVSDTASQPMELLCCTETTREEKAEKEGEKQEVLLLSPASPNPTLQAIVVDFNKQSEKYRVILEECEYTNDEDIRTLSNVRLSGKDSPDLLLINYMFYDIYKEAKILEDLTPYLAKSECWDKGSFLEPVLAPFVEGEAVYAIPKNFMIMTMVCRKSQAKNLQKKEGFSVERFVTYLEKNEDVKFEWDGYSIGILQYCMRYGMDDFVDFEKGNCDFTGDKFRNLFLRLEDMNFLSDFQGNEWEEVIEEGGKIFSEDSIYDFYCMERLKSQYNGEMKVLGYPTTDGEMKTMLRPLCVLGILRNSRCKQGAWEFLEYYMLNYQGSEGFPSDKEAFEKEKALAQEKRYTYDENGKKTEAAHGTTWKGEKLYAVEEVQIEQIMDAIECAEPVRQEEEIIFNMIREELTYYLNKDKSLDETLNIIQNRVQLYLKENM